MGYISLYKKICTYTLTLATLLTFVSFFAVTVNAQIISGSASGGNPIINITAKVEGCGNNIIETSFGEQCDGTDLGNQTCSSLGFSGGTLSCQSSCIFDITLCQQNTNTNTNTGSNGTRNLNWNNSFLNSPSTNLIFTGIGEPGSTFFVIGNNNYMISTTVDSDGNFTIMIPEPVSGNYDFKFYTVSETGIFGPYEFSTDVLKNTTTYIDNIFIPYIGEEIEKVEIGDTKISDGLIDFLTIIKDNKKPALNPEIISIFFGKKDNGLLNNFCYGEGYNERKEIWYPNVHLFFMTPFFGITSYYINALSHVTNNYSNRFIISIVSYSEYIINTIEWLNDPLKD